MIYLPDDKMFTNKFVHIEVPTKRQIFARTGQTAVSPAGSYTGDDPARIGKKPTESAQEFISTAEKYEIPKSE